MEALCRRLRARALAPVGLALLAALLASVAARSESRRSPGASSSSSERMSGPWHYPAAPRGGVVDDYFGTRVADPYRWLEQLDSEQTRAWVSSENELSAPFLNSLPRRDFIKQRLTALRNFPRFGVPVHEGKRYFFTYNTGLQNQAVLYVADALTAGDQLPSGARVLLDVNTL